MHDLNEPTNILEREVVESSEMLGKECLSCGKILAYHFFARDSSYRDGRRDQCQQCESAPRLSTAEHTARLKEMNYYSHAVKRQRWDNQEDYEDEIARVGHQMPCNEFLSKVRKLVPSLFITEGRISGDLAIYRIYPCPQPRLNGRDFEYLFYIPTGILPEFSQYEFNAMDVPVRESKRGWRTVLLRLIVAGLLTEETCDRHFGKASGIASTVWYRRLFELRNRK